MQPIHCVRRTWRCRSHLHKVWICHYYRPQGKGMFSEVSVSHSVHQGEGCIRGICIWGVCIQGCLHPGWSAYRGTCLQRGMHPGDMHPESLHLVGLTNHPILTSSGGHSTGRYASYWNAFLFQPVFAVVSFSSCATWIIPPGLAQLSFNWAVNCPNTESSCCTPVSNVWIG